MDFGCSAVVVIQHLDPDRPSMLTKVIEGATAFGRRRSCIHE
jgi:hypothetical protein